MWLELSCFILSIVSYINITQRTEPYMKKKTSNTYEVLIDGII